MRKRSSRRRWKARFRLGQWVTAAVLIRYGLSDWVKQFPKVETNDYMHQVRMVKS